MAITQQRNEFKVLILVLLGIPLISSTNIDCHGKSFHCINSTHFMICVDLGGGVLTTVDDYVIRCPPPTVCEIDNRFECEFPTATTPAVNIRTTVTNDPTISNTFSWKEIAMTTILPINNGSATEYSNQEIYNTFNTVNPVTSTTAGTTTIQPALEGNRSSLNVETVANIKNIVPKNLETSTESMIATDNATIELITSAVLSQQNTSLLETTTGSYISEITSTIVSATIPFTPSEIFSEQTTSILAINNVTVNSNLAPVDNNSSDSIIARNVSNVTEGSETSTTATLFASTTSNITHLGIDNKLENSTGIYFTNISSSTVEENTTSSANVSSTQNITNRNISNPVNITETGSKPDNALPQSNQSIFENNGKANLSSTELPSTDKYWVQSTIATTTVDNITLQNEYNLSSNKTVVPAEESSNTTIAVSEQGSENSVPQTTTSFLSVEQWTQPISETLNTASESSTLSTLETITGEQWTQQIPIPTNVSLDTNLEQGNLTGNLNMNNNKDDGNILSKITTSPSTQQRNQTIVEISTEPSIAYGNKTTNYIALTTEEQINQETTKNLKNDTLVITTSSYSDITNVSSANENLLKGEEILVNETISPISQNSTSQDTNYNVTTYSTISPLDTTISANIVNESIINTTITSSPATIRSFEPTGDYSTTKDVVLENTTYYSTDAVNIKNENLLKTIPTSSPSTTESYQHSTTKDSPLQNTSTYSSGSTFVTTISYYLNTYDENTLNNTAAQTTSASLLTDPWNQHIAENITIPQKPLEKEVNYSTDPSWAIEKSSTNSTINESITDSGGTTTASPVEQLSNRADNSTLITNEEQNMTLITTTSPSIEQYTNVENKSTKNNYLDNTTQSSLSTTETVLEQVKPSTVINPELKYNKSDNEILTVVAVTPSPEEQWSPSSSGASTSRITIIPLVDSTQPIIESSTLQSAASIKETLATFSIIGETETPGLLLQNDSSPTSETNNTILAVATTNAYATVPKTESKVPNTPASVVEGNMFTAETILRPNPEIQNNTMATTNDVTTDQPKEVTKSIIITNSIPSNDNFSSTAANENSTIHNPLAYTVLNTEATLDFYTPPMPNVFSTSDIGIKTDQVIEQRTELKISSTEASNIATVVETTVSALHSSNNIMTVNNNLQSTKSIYFNEEFSGVTIASSNEHSNSDLQSKFKNATKPSADNVVPITTESNFIKQSTFATSSVINTSTVSVTESNKVTNSKSDMKNTTPETNWQGTQSLQNSSATELISTPSGSTPTDTINSINTLAAADPNPNSNDTKHYTDNRLTDSQTASDSIISTSNPSNVTSTPLQTTEQLQGLIFTKESVSLIGQSDADTITSKTTTSILQENNITNTQEVQVTIPSETSNNVEAPLVTATVTDPIDKITLNIINEFDSSNHGINRTPGTLVPQTANINENNLPTNNIPVNIFENGNTASANNGLGETSNNVETPLVTATVTDPTAKITLNNVNEFDSSSHGIDRIPGTLATETANTNKHNLPTNNIPVNTFENGNTASANNGLGETSNNLDAPLVTATVTDPIDKITLDNINEFDSSSHGVNRISGIVATETANTIEKNLPTNIIPVNTLENGNTASVNSGLSEPESNKEQQLPTYQYISQNNSTGSVLAESTISTTVVQGAIVVEISNKKSTIGSDADNFTSSFDGQQTITDMGNDTTTTSLLNEGTNIENEYIGNAKTFTTVSPQELTEIRYIKSTDLATQNILSTSGYETKTVITNTNIGLKDSYYPITATTIPQATTSPNQHIEVSTKNYESSSSVSSQLLKVSSSSQEPTRTTFSTKLISISTPYLKPSSTGNKTGIATGEIEQATTEPIQNTGIKKEISSTTTQRTSTQSLDSISQSFNGGNTDDLNINNNPEQKKIDPTAIKDNVVTTKIHDASVTVPTQATEISSTKTQRTSTQSSESTSQTFNIENTHVETTNNNPEQKKNDPTAIKDNVVTTKIHDASVTVPTQAKEISSTKTQRTSTQSSEPTSQSFNIENTHVETTNNNPEQKKNDPTAIKDNVVTTKIHDASVTVPIQAKEISSTKTQRTSTQSSEPTSQSFNIENTHVETTNNNPEQKKNDPTAIKDNVVTTKIHDASVTVPTQAKEISSTKTQRTSTQSSEPTSQSFNGENTHVETTNNNPEKKKNDPTAIKDNVVTTKIYDASVTVLTQTKEISSSKTQRTSTQSTESPNLSSSGGNIHGQTTNNNREQKNQPTAEQTAKTENVITTKIRDASETVPTQAKEISSITTQSTSTQSSDSTSQSNYGGNIHVQTNYLIESPVFNCQKRIRGRFADVNDCKKFYICFGHAVPIIGYCPNNTVFSETITRCTKNLSHCVRNNQFKCITEGRFSDYLKDNTYYICVKNKHDVFVRFKFQCQNGYHLNKTTVKCTENEVSSLSNQSVSSKDSASESQSATERSPKIKAVNSNSNNGFECEEEGKFPDPDNCRKYYVCTLKNSEYTRKKKKCDKDELFHKDKKKCVDADSYEC